MSESEGRLFVVGTPIGNLEDLSPRALKTLKEVDLILAEDTRVIKKVLSNYSIKKETKSFDAKREREKTGNIIDLLKAGKKIALVSDAGTPGISDPGSFLVDRVREELPEVTIVPIPGPSSITTALSVSGMDSDSFVFFGFLPRKKGKQKILSEISKNEKTSVFFESPHRILKTLKALAEILNTNRKVFVAREMTKIYEEHKIGNAADIYEYYMGNPDKVKGEFVVVVEPK